MDNHPIPQDVTGFQFKLIGSMTVKQFGYVVFGVIMAVVLYYLPLNSALGVIFKTIFIPLCGASGFLIAFLPIEGRPVDVMIGNFLKALFAPNQYVYHKTGRLFDFAHLPVSKPMSAKHPNATQTALDSNKARQLKQLLQTTHVQKQNKLDQKETAFLQALSLAPAAPAFSLPQQPTASPAPSPVPPSKPEQPTADSLAKAEEQLTKELQQAKKDEQAQQATGVSDAAHQKAALLERQVQALHFQRQQLEQQLMHLQNQLASQQGKPQAAPAVSPQQQAANQAQQQAQKAQQELSKRGLPHIPDTPNVIVGLVKDPRGNVLPNILVEVKDKDGNPVRAFKTNALGQFASATPLAPGIYTVELEDPKKQNRFDVIQLAASNQILLPIEIISHDAREELRKQLFN